MIFFEDLQHFFTIRLQPALPYSQQFCSKSLQQYTDNYHITERTHIHRPPCFGAGDGDDDQTPNTLGMHHNNSMQQLSYYGAYPHPEASLFRW